MAGSLLSSAKVIIEKVYLREKKELITIVVVQVGQHSCTVMASFQAFKSPGFDSRLFNLLSRS